MQVAKAVVALCLLVALATAQTPFSATNVLITDAESAGGPGRTYRADIQYWPTSGQQSIFYTVPFSGGSFQILEDFVNGLRFVQCSDSCNVEPLDTSLPNLANTQGITTVSYPAYVRTFDIDSSSTIGSLSSQPTLPSLCQAQTSATSAANECLPFGLPCGTSCLCLGCTDGDNCTTSDTCALDSNNQLTCTGQWACGLPATVIALKHHHHHHNHVAVGLGVGLGVGIPVVLLLLLLFFLLPCLILALLWSRRERRPTVVRTTATPVAAAAAPVPVAVGNPLYAEPWRTTNIPQSMVDNTGRAVPVVGGAPYTQAPYTQAAYAQAAEPSRVFVE